MSQTKRKWKVKEVRAWLLAKLYECCEQEGLGARLHWDPRKEEEDIAAGDPPHDLIHAVCEQLKEQHMIRFSSSCDGFLTAALTPKGYALIREHREEELE